jgi:hypothetical protein
VAVGEAAHIGSLVDLVGSRRVLSNRLIKQGRDFEAEPSKQMIFDLGFVHKGAATTFPMVTSGAYAHGADSR